MPYWRRQDVLLKNLHRYRELYGNIEIVVVDDGSPEPAIIDPLTTLVRLPLKDHALNPCVPFNVGVRVATGDIIVLTNPEIIHREPILHRMLQALGRGYKYVAAACWNETTHTWYCHSCGPTAEQMGRAPIPPGAGLHFCAMLTRGLYEEIGGFTEEYRNGQGYEDNDFLWKIETISPYHHDDVDEKFCILDDCVTEHIACPPTVWPRGTNKALFESRWPHLLRASR